MNRWVAPALAGLVAAALGYQGTLVATPFALMRAASNKVGRNAPVNRFSFPPMTTAANQTIVRPSPDLSYSICPFDLSHGPLLVRIEPIPGHYWSVSVFDARTDVAVVSGDRDTRGRAAMLALVRPGQVAPSGWRAVPVAYDKGIALIRILLTDPSDYAQVDALRRRSFCRPA